jgi:hypothetical protein
MEVEPTAYRLCIYCRGLESIAQPCPFLQGRSQHGTRVVGDSTSSIQHASALSQQENEMMCALQSRPSSLCQRCSDYNVIDVFTKSEPLDQIDRGEVDMRDYHSKMAPYQMPFGRPSSVLLTPSCQFCRLLYCILPRGLEPDDTLAHLEPYRSHIRGEGWETVPSDIKTKSAILLGFADGQNLLAPISDAFRPGDLNIRYSMMSSPAIAMETSCTPTDRRFNNAKPISSVLDLSLLLKGLELCEQLHGTYCRAEKPSELLTTRMIDVDERKVVRCPPDCDYIALSYVWGGVQPVVGALENKCLPRTIEDAIIVTKALRRRYLWVSHMSRTLTTLELLTVRLTLCVLINPEIQAQHS